MENDINSKARVMKKILKIVFKILYQILIILCVLLIAIIVFQKVTESNRSVGGYRIFRVITGSMIPEYDVGEVVIAKETNPADIEVGDDIVYQGQYGDYNGKIIMHQVTKIDVDENNNRTFHAKGLNVNSVEDPQIKPNQIYGVVKFKSKVLSVLYKLATSIYSSFVIITILVLNVFVSFKFTGKSKMQQLGESYEELDGDETIEDETESKECDDEETEENDELDENE